MIGQWADGCSCSYFTCLFTIDAILHGLPVICFVISLVPVSFVLPVDWRARIKTDWTRQEVFYLFRCHVWPLKMSAKKFAPVPSGGIPLELGLVAVHGNFGRPGDIPMDLPVIRSPLFLNVHVNNMRHQGERISTPRMPHFSKRIWWYNQNHKVNHGKSTGFQLIAPSLPLSKLSSFVISSGSRQKSYRRALEWIRSKVADLGSGTKLVVAIR